MKTFKILFLLIAVTLVSCSKDNEQETSYGREFSTKSRYVSPNGYVLADSEGALIAEIFGANATGYKINAVNFKDARTNLGAAAIIEYTQNGKTSNIGFVKGEINYNYDNANVTVNVQPAANKINSTSFKCAGQGCCYTEVRTDNDGTTFTFGCKCEGNSGANSGCSLTVNKSDKFLSPNH